jgi:hypothetical protein
MVIKRHEWHPTPERPYRTLSDEQIDYMEKLLAYQGIGDPPPRPEWAQRYSDAHFGE